MKTALQIRNEFAAKHGATPQEIEADNIVLEKRLGPEAFAKINEPLTDQQAEGLYACMAKVEKSVAEHGIPQDLLGDVAQFQSDSTSYVLLNKTKSIPRSGPSARHATVKESCDE